MKLAIESGQYPKVQQGASLVAAPVLMTLLYNLAAPAGWLTSRIRLAAFIVFFLLEGVGVALLRASCEGAPTKTHKAAALVLSAVGMLLFVGFGLGAVITYGDVRQPGGLLFGGR